MRNEIIMILAERGVTHRGDIIRLVDTNSALAVNRELSFLKNEGMVTTVFDHYYALTDET